MSANLRYVIFALCLGAVMSGAIPQNFTTPQVDNNGTEVNGTSGGSRQAKALDVATLARNFLTPANIAQFKSFFGGLSSVGSLSNVLAFNPGNLVVLTLLAGTALLVAPTLLSLFGFGSTVLGRSGKSEGKNMDDKPGSVPTEMAMNFYKSIDDLFRSYNIDASTCMQRFACTASRNTAAAFRTGKPTYVDNMLNYFLSSGYAKSLIGHTKFMDAIDHGKNQGDCEIQYGKCPFSWDKVVQYLPKFNFNHPTPRPSVPEGNSSENTAQ